MPEEPRRGSGTDRDRRTWDEERRRAQHAGRHMHTPPSRPAELGALRWALVATVLLFAVKVGLALWGRSLAVGGDALHSLADVGAYATAYGAARVASRPPTQSRTYGMERTTVLAAVVNGFLLMGLGLMLAGDATLSWVGGHGTLTVGPMVADGVVGLAGTLLTAGILIRKGVHTPHGHEGHEAMGEGDGVTTEPRDANVWAAVLHAGTDAVTSLAVLAAAAVTALWHWPFASALAAQVIGLGIAWSSLGLVRETLDMLLEAVPKNVRVAEVVRAIEAIPGVHGVHHVHIWTVGTREWALSGHVVVHAAALRDGEAVVDRTQHMLEDRFGIAHSTIQMESDALPDDDPGPEPPNSPL